MRGPTRLGFGFRSSSTPVDIGDDPPLMIADKSDDHPALRSVSLRWLTGTILTGFTSIFLMGGALMAALNNPSAFAALSSPAAEAAGDGIPLGGVAFGQKSDRIQPVQEEVSSRQILQVSTVSKQGERDLIKLRPFAKIVATLTTKKSEYADEIPAYDALRIFADTSTEAATAAAGSTTPADDQIYGAEVDGEVSVKISDFPVGESPGGSEFTTAEAEAMVLTSASSIPGEAQVAALSFVDARRFNAEDGEADPFSAIGVRIIPENVSNVAKSDGDGDDFGIEEKVIALGEKDTFRSQLQKNELTAADAEEITAALSEILDLDSRHAGQKIRVAYAASDLDGGQPVPIRVSIYEDGAHQATVARADDNTFVRADEPNSEPVSEVAEAEPEPASPGAAARVYEAIYATALEQQVPKPLIDTLIRIFAYDIDFQGRVSPGDSLEVFHSLPDDGPEASDPEILFASLTLGGVTKRFYRFRTPDDGIVDYYDDEGRSAKKFLMRKPMTTGILRSGFGMRRHPILGYTRMHTGVDFAAPRGTPILAAGNGVVEEVGRTSGYGNFTLIKHTNGYETGYGHQSAYAKGLKPGMRVRQGQIIGYVGSTGLSTGPHLHFEIRVNGKPVDPLRIRLPRGRVLQDDFLVTYEAERQRIDTLLGNPTTPTKVASRPRRRSKHRRVGLPDRPPGLFTLTLAEAVSSKPESAGGRPTARADV